MIPGIFRLTGDHQVTKKKLWYEKVQTRQLQSRVPVSYRPQWKTWQIDRLIDKQTVRWVTNRLINRRMDGQADRQTNQENKWCHLIPLPSNYSSRHQN